MEDKKNLLTNTRHVLHCCPVLAHEVEQSAHLPLGFLGPSACLVKSRTEAETVQLRRADVPLFSRVRLGRLAKARHERLELVDGVGDEERCDQTPQSVEYVGALVRFAQVRGSQRVSQQLQPLLVPPIQNRQTPEAKARIDSAGREEAVLCADIPCPREVRRGFLRPSKQAEVVCDFAQSHALVPEALHCAQELDAPFLQPNGRARMVVAVSQVVRPGECREDRIASGIWLPVQQLFHAPLPLE
eukprot:CAMPEP_0180355986 /NCGR_PEP_ID=MMETSP0989-20121125/9088_1 /TAXON_ID=697907 /ORGANISM="non described non described, Strain CCMP2293" /LENGTH=243 /DNA_ID=CAMNT_0022345999 /DNA_START=875 /DNA_END=1604 /DNA_ORIENTATION=+